MNVDRILTRVLYKELWACNDEYRRYHDAKLCGGLHVIELQGARITVGGVRGPNTSSQCPKIYFTPFWMAREAGDINFGTIISSLSMPYHGYQSNGKVAPTSRTRVGSTESACRVVASEM